MSDVEEHETCITVNDLEISIRTKVRGDFKNVIYELDCVEEIAPEIVAVALYLMSCDICEGLKMKIDDLIKDLVDCNSEWH
jgi:hypothetical protein